MAVVLTPPCSTVSPSDEGLLAAYRRGSEQALETLFQRYRLLAYRVAYRLLGNEADALDAVQEGFVKALTHLDGFEGRSSFKTWLLRIVSNAALDLGRQRGRRETMSLEYLPGPEEVIDTRTSDGVPGQELERADLRALLEQALARLPEAQRKTFVLHVDAELSYREVAEVLGISIGTVMSRLFYARQKLRTLLAEQLPS